MNQHAKIEIRHSTCPHDCPSACALDIEVVEGRSIGRVRGSKKQTYTAGVVCAKVARYAERIHHPERLMYPMRRTGPKGSGQFARISWDEALDEIADRFNQAEREYGAGHVDLWDRGTWVPEEAAVASLRRGKLKFELKRRRLKGRWALVRMGNASTRKKDLGLLMKLADDSAR